MHAPDMRTSRALKKPTAITGPTASFSVRAAAESILVVTGPVFFLIQLTMPTLQERGTSEFDWQLLDQPHTSPERVKTPLGTHASRPPL